MVKCPLTKWGGRVISCLLLTECVQYKEHKTTERIKIAAGKNVAYTVFLTTMRIKSFSVNLAGDVNGVTALSGQKASITDDNSSTYSKRSTKTAFLGVACSAPLP